MGLKFNADKYANNNADNRIKATAVRRCTPQHIERRKKIGAYVNESPIREMFLHSFLPFSSSALDNGDEIRIAIQNRDTHTLPSDSFIYIEGKITKPSELLTEISIAHNGLANLFNEMKYEINSTEVQRVKKPRITSAMKGYCSYSPADAKILQNAAWDITNKKDNTFSGCIPLKHVFSFCADYKRILINGSQQLILNKSMSNTSALHNTSVVGGDMATASVKALVVKVKVQLTRVL
ncbi:hypothetical protein AGLY_016567 [Aphis glycines]|uniref:Double jelly roll-like domain-containing protein n=1 Tax=Aphis glycines TaxID=307491 RepID=A0A6G0SX37_APHGL|nr:hypothetical protein AGLY_016567 [Aphis glycines]